MMSIACLNRRASVRAYEVGAYIIELLCKARPIEQMNCPDCLGHKLDHEGDGEHKVKGCDKPLLQTVNFNNFVLKALSVHITTGSKSERSSFSWWHMSQQAAKLISVYFARYDKAYLCPPL